MEWRHSLDSPIERLCGKELSSPVNSKEPRPPSNSHKSATSQKQILLSVEMTSALANYPDCNLMRNLEPEPLR